MYKMVERRCSDITDNEYTGGVDKECNDSVGNEHTSRVRDEQDS